MEARKPGHYLEHQVHPRLRTTTSEDDYHHRVVPAYITGSDRMEFIVDPRKFGVCPGCNGEGINTILAKNNVTERACPNGACVDGLVPKRVE